MSRFQAAYNNLTRYGPVSKIAKSYKFYEIAERPWGWLSTSAEVDDRVYVGSAAWRQQQRNAGLANPIGPITGNRDPPILTAHKRTDDRPPDPRRGECRMHRIRFGKRKIKIRRKRK